MTDITIRKIEEGDLGSGFLESLDSLKTASSLSSEKAKEILKKIKANPDHVIFVAVLNGRIVGSTTILIEQKFIHDGGLVGHIEDVVVSKEHEGRGIGFKIMQAALEYARAQGCYKTILDCDDKVKPFYERLGFKRHSNGMRFDH
ncbi:GNAT family N-acetyltransferase [Candidatus Nitrosotenuis chungbukensis]|uniref:GNAT family N-acetyltransferase n=1 Tax=Candidatus Nitrosotenuis chungbukensis TaxID=1353246 RepID=UPI0005B2653D|nr:GNAT family N-acetyltransferase [Candidatus Nitrosotenuis chungbukensis]WKT57151.1 GNAT family N-acetyltransferase [Candidatus Nitrosotenuis chungbukensis]